MLVFDGETGRLQETESRIVFADREPVYSVVAQINGVEVIDEGIAEKRMSRIGRDHLVTGMFPRSKLEIRQYFRSTEGGLE